MADLNPPKNKNRGAQKYANIIASKIFSCAIMVKEGTKN